MTCNGVAGLYNRKTMNTRRELAAMAAAGSLAAWLPGCGGTPDADLPIEPVAGDGDVLSRSIVFDAHIDTPTRMLNEGIRLGETKSYHKVDISRMRTGGITAAFFAIYTSAKDKTPLEAVKKALEISDLIVQEVRSYPEDLILAVSSADILRAKQENKIAILLSLEGGHLIDSSLPVLREFYRLGARSLGLTHSVSTPWAQSVEDSNGPGGLTEFGHDVVRELNRLGMIADLAHADDQTFFDTIKTSKAPIISSHTNCRGVADSPRNMSDEMLKALAENGGVIDIGYYNGMVVENYGKPMPDLSDLQARREAINKEFAEDRDERLSELWKVDKEEADRIGRVSFDQLLDHFEHAAAVAGVDHVGFGSDLDAARHLYPEAVDDISETVNLVPGLGERGFSEEDISKILGGNNLRVLEEVERVAGES